MCGCFTLRTGSAALAEQFQLADIPDLPPRYNIAPTQEVAVIRHTNGSNTAALLRWGLVPFWARDTAIGAKMINARAETVAEKPAFRAAFQSRRCLIMADGFYEWQAMGSGRRKQPIYLHMRDRAHLPLPVCGKPGKGRMAPCKAVLSSPPSQTIWYNRSTIACQ
jgi:putative SOS response-associated peptidase YedK